MSRCVLQLAVVHTVPSDVWMVEALKKLRKKLQAAPSATTAQLERLAELEATEKELALVRPSQARASGYCGGAPGEPQGSRNTSLRASRP